MQGMKLSGGEIECNVGGTNGLMVDWMIGCGMYCALFILWGCRQGEMHLFFSFHFYNDKWQGE